MKGELDFPCPSFSSADQIRQYTAISMEVIDEVSEVGDTIWYSDLHIKRMMYYSDNVEGVAPFEVEEEPR